MYIYSFGLPASEFPHPDENWSKFLKLIHDLNRKTNKVYNPRNEQMCYWIHESHLNNAFNTEASHCSIM